MRQSAFTFIEILFVVLIITVLVAVALPSFRSTHDNLLLRSVSRNIQAAFEFLHQRSIVEEELMHLTIDNDKKEYLTQADDDTRSVRRYSWPKDISIEATQPTITFYPDGTIDPITLQITLKKQPAVKLTTQGVFGGSKIITQ